MTRHLLIVDGDEERPRDLRQEELAEVIDETLLELIEINQGQQNLLEWTEARLIQLALEQALHNKSRAARQLGVPRKRLERRVRKYQQNTREKVDVCT
ncbi:MAG: hypothetical protein HYW07_15595 [Candidatus Latescibacteria bacterium]|nr:hypothetical protein [Candidatus Latescibacterota bacterium]